MHDAPGGADRPPTRLPRVLQDHLGSRDVARVVYGAIIGLALVVALEHHPPGVWQTVAGIVATAIAVGLAEAYAEFVGVEARERRHLRGSEVHELLVDSLAVVTGAGFPAVFFVLAGLGAMELDTAFTVAKWSGLGLICGYGYLAGRLAGTPVHRALWHAFLLGVVGGTLIGVKALLH